MPGTELRASGVLCWVVPTAACEVPPFISQVRKVSLRDLSKDRGAELRLKLGMAGPLFFNRTVTLLPFPPSCENKRRRDC